jgi:hypothetical protein
MWMIPMPPSRRGLGPLSFWKHHGPSESFTDEDHDALLEALNSAAQTTGDPAVEAAAIVAASGNLDAMVALALDYAAREPADECDFELSIGWLLLAASASALARFAIGWFLARRAGALRRQIARGTLDTDSRPRIELLDRQAHIWLADSIAEHHWLENLVGPLPTIAAIPRTRDADTTRAQP